MSDLIRRSDLLALYEECEGLKVPVEVVVQNIKDMPTIYDVDKVVEQLESYKDKGIASCVTNDAWELGACYTMDKAIDKAIEIVKAGGVDGIQ